MSNNPRCLHGPALFTLIAMVSTVLTGPLAAQQPLAPGWQEVGTILQTPAVDGGGYVRFNLPRSDLSVRLGGVSIPAGFALTSWIGFDGTPDSATAMGDLVLTAGELGPVLGELSRQAIMVMAVHNHLAGEEPQVTYVHIHMTGPALSIARALEPVLKLTGVPRPVRPAIAAAVTIDSGAVFAALGKHGKASGAMAQVGFVLVPGTVSMQGATVLPALGYASPINVLQVTPGRTVATGDFAVTAAQLPRLLSALAANGISVTAVHHHLIEELPRLYFVHFWGDGPQAVVLRGLRAAVDATAGP